MARRAALGVVAAIALLVACTATSPPDPDPTTPTPPATPTPPPVYTAELRLPDAPATVLDGADAAALATAASAALYTSAPIAVVAQGFDPALLLRAASVAVALGAPLLLDPGGVPGAPPDAAPLPDPAPSPDPGPSSNAGVRAVSGTRSDAGTPPDPGTAEAPVPPATPTSDLVQTELARLGVRAVLTVGDVEIRPTRTMTVVPVPDDEAGLAALLGLDLAPQVVEATGDPTADVTAVATLDRDAPALLSTEGGGVGNGTEAGEGTAPDDEGTAPDDEGTAPDDEGTAPEDEDAAPSTDADGAASTDGTPSTGATPTDEPSPLVWPTPTPTRPALPPTELAEPLDGGLVLTTGQPSELAAVATARAAGVDVLTVVSGDPRVDPAVIRAIADAQPTATIGLGAGFGSGESLGWKVATAATGVELPGGGQTLFPGRRMVAMYGTPTFPALGILGEQDVAAAITRVQGIAAEYQALTTDLVVPAFEIIVTVASAGAGPDGNYSNELPVETFIPWVEAARDAGVYVVLDLQPGRTDFLTQARLYEPLLLYPNVGLALDPEWRLGPDQVHLVQIGSVDVSEVNAVADYLAELTRANHLPQKLLVLHQFMLRMIQGRENVTTTHEELAVLIHADGQGSQGAKAGTWQALHVGAPDGVVWGWKNFIDEDSPTLTPAETYQIQPTPHFVSYQ